MNPFALLFVFSCGLSIGILVGRWDARNKLAKPTAGTTEAPAAAATPAPAPPGWSAPAATPPGPSAPAPSAAVSTAAPAPAAAPAPPEAQATGAPGTPPIPAGTLPPPPPPASFRAPPGSRRDDDDATSPGTGAPSSTPPEPSSPATPAAPTARLDAEPAPVEPAVAAALADDLLAPIPKPPPVISKKARKAGIDESKLTVSDDILERLRRAEELGVDPRTVQEVLAKAPPPPPPQRQVDPALAEAERRVLERLRRQASEAGGDTGVPAG